MDWLTIERPKINRMRQESERYRRMQYVKHNGVSCMGDGDAIANGRRSGCLASEK
jgi:hypothetical protein